MKAYLLLLTVLMISSILMIRSLDAAQASDAAPVACPMIAKACPDGSYVSPQGPNCEFADCLSDGDTQAKPSTEDESSEADDCDDDDCGNKKTDEQND